MNVLVVVQARHGSSRLPGKAVHVIAGQPMLAHVLQRAKLVSPSAHVLLVTSTSESDAALVEIAHHEGVAWFRGDERDVLGRFEAAAERFAPDVLMRLTGDCPLLDPAVAATVLADYLRTDVPHAEYVTNDTTCSGWPDGMDVEVFSRAALRLAQAAVPKFAPGKVVEGSTARDREHVTPWMRRRLPWRLVTSAAPLALDLLRLKLSVDTSEDLERARGIFGFLEDGATSLTATISAWRALEGRLMTVRHKVGRRR